jgi:hypothetical protein
MTNLRRVASITFVAWCLIVPPVSQDQQQVEDKAPLSQWAKVGSYTTAAACRDQLAKITAVIAGNINYSVIQKRALEGKCVAADDPRLHSDNFEMN